MTFSARLAAATAILALLSFPGACIAGLEVSSAPQTASLRSRLVELTEVDAPSCDDLPNLPASADRCSFVRQHCSSEGLIHFFSIYHCYAMPFGIIPAALTLFLFAALLVLLFNVIGRTADVFFSSILSQISQDMGLPPRLAGVTLLALGNGAPDLSSCIAAVRAGSYPMALGALTGGSMFVGCVVAGKIITASGGVKCRGAQIRDVLTQFIAVTTVTCIVASGRVTYGSILTLLILYAAYVVVVAVADFTKRAGVEWDEVGRGLSKRISQSFARRGGLAAPLLAGRRAGRWSSTEMEPAGAADAHAQQTAAENGSSGPLVASPPTVTLVSAYQPHQQQYHAHISTHSTAMLQQTQSDGSRAGGEGTGSEVELVSTTPPPSRPTSPSRKRSPVRYGDEHRAAHSANSHDGVGSRNNNGTIERSQTVPSVPQHVVTAAHTHATHARRAVSLHPGYDKLVHMPAEEYRRRALADMAAARSFYVRRPEAASVDGEDFGDEDIDERVEEESLTGEEEEEEEVVVAAVDGQLRGRVAGLRDAERGEYTPPAVAPLGEEIERRDVHHHHAAAALHGGGGGGRSRPVHETMEEKTPTWPVVARLRGLLEAAMAPILLLLRCTIPMVEPTSYQRKWLLISAVLSPAFLCVYVVGIGHPFELLIAFACGAIAAFICAAATANDPLTPPFWDCGTGFPLGTAIVAVYGFGVAAMWIDVFASEIVGALHFFGLLAGVHEAVLGVTILAWGNSLTDLVANTALANKSAAGTSMAMTACFAGPLFNMLLGLGIGFWAFLTDAGKASTTVEFDPVVIVGCGFILVNCAGVVATAVLERPGHWLPVRLGWAMMAWYGLYMAVILAVSVL